MDCPVIILEEIQFLKNLSAKSKAESPVREDDDSH